MARKMFDCNEELLNFFNQNVALAKKHQDEMRSRRDANRKRLRDGLKKNGDPASTRDVSQGSYAMYTMVQDDANDYDIDDGSVFRKSDLVGDRGAEKSALDARKMVRDAIDDGSFETPPEVRTNCVRVFYKAGYHVDVPVYRELDDGSLELASSNWKGSSPTEVTDWYNQAVIDKSPDQENGRQMRRDTRLIKFHSKSRDSWKKKTASGFEISVLVDECYVADRERDDISLYETMKSISDRLNSNLEVEHPTRNEMLTSGPDDTNTRFLRDKLKEAIDSLDVLFNDNCTRLVALKAWDNVFKHTYWKNLICEEEKNQKEKEEKAARLREGNLGIAIGLGLAAATIAAGATAKTLKNTTSYGSG